MGGWCLITVVTSPPLLSLYVDERLTLEVGLPFFFDPAPNLQHRSTYQDADGEFGGRMA